MKKVLSLIFFFLLASIQKFAQCAMCKATLENQEEGSNIGSSINEGILYLMPIPYILLAIIGGVFYYRYKKMKNA